MSDAGIVTCLDAKTGSQLWRKRVGGQPIGFAAVGRRQDLFLERRGRDDGARAGQTYQELARNRLDGGFMATPAAVGSALFVRTRTHLYRVETPAGAAAGSAVQAK